MKITIRLSTQEGEALRAIAEDECRTPKRQATWIVRRALAGAMFVDAVESAVEAARDRERPEYDDEENDR